VLAAGARRYVNQLSRLVDDDLVPRAPRDRQGLARSHLSFPVTAFQLQADPDAAGEQVQQFVGVGVQLPVVHRRSAQRGRLDRVAVNAPRAAASLHEHGTTRLPLQPDDPAGQLERLSGRYLSGYPHRCLLWRPVHCLLFPAAVPWFPIGPW
jgi:hypothetical protein